MPEPIYQIRRSRYFHLHPDGSIEIGTHPPGALRIRNPPPFLPFLIEVAAEPLTIAQIVDATANAHPEWDASTIVDAVADLITLGVFQKLQTRNRYDRHHLYFDLLGVDAITYDAILSSKTVGIVGTGGIGSTAALLLTAAGVGRLVISDGDHVEPNNLTRTILFDETSVGRLKVTEAAERLRLHNGRVGVIAVPNQIDGAAFVERHFSQCDVLLASADRPVDVHKWIDQAAKRLGIPYLKAGYEEAFGVLGPLVIPGQTPCFTCNVLCGNEPIYDARELNHAYQAPSYGPLNMIVAAAAVNEILRHLLGLPVESAGRRILIDSTSYERHVFQWRASDACDCGAATRTTHGSGRQFDAIASSYEATRDTRSLNALVLDDLMIELSNHRPSALVLDLGCGIGTIARALAARGHRVVCIDDNTTMLRILRARLPRDLRESVSIIRGDIMTTAFPVECDTIILNLVLDHIQDPPSLLRKCRGTIASDGNLIIALPHPWKDAGRWTKSHTNGQWRYGDLVIDNYFYEGHQWKHREDADGNTIIPTIRSFSRTIESYASLIRNAGFVIAEILEPALPPTAASPTSALARAMRIPYFVVFNCVPMTPTR